MATTPIYGWRTPDLGEAPHGPNAIQDLAEDIEAALADAGYTTYNPTFVSAGSVPFGLGTSTRVGWYRVWKGWCDVVALITFGTGVSGGTDQLRFVLPVKGSPSGSPARQFTMCRLWTPSHGHWPGELFIPTNSDYGYPYFNNSQTDVRVNVFRNADPSGSAGTGVPQIPGGFPIQVTGKFSVNGRYRVV